MSEAPQSGDPMAVDPASPEFERKVIGLIAKKKKLAPSAITAASTFQELGIETVATGGDLTFEAVQEIGLAHGLVDNKSCSIDERWQALRFVYRVRDR